MRERRERWDDKFTQLQDARQQTKQQTNKKKNNNLQDKKQARRIRKTNKTQSYAYLRETSAATHTICHPSSSVVDRPKQVDKKEIVLEKKNQSVRKMVRKISCVSQLAAVVVLAICDAIHGIARRMSTNRLPPPAMQLPVCSTPDKCHCFCSWPLLLGSNCISGAPSSPWSVYVACSCVVFVAQFVIVYISHTCQVQNWEWERERESIVFRGSAKNSFSLSRARKVI